ncbi:MAG: SIR2 family protein [Candidatus Thermoplasmatota archaeon]|nr:SIR2 family protein [Candidatus Thermoplasmatota archaeon]
MIKRNVVFFIGAGFTKAVVNTAPKGSEFFEFAFDEKRSFIKDLRVQRVKQFIENNYYTVGKQNYPKIEDVSSLIDYVIQRKESLSKNYLFEDVLEIKKDMIFLISTVIKKTIEESTNPDILKPSRIFIEKLHELYKRNIDVSIISTNYDIIMDNALLEIIQSSNYQIRLRKNIFWNPKKKLEQVKVHSNEHWTYQGGNATHEGTLNEGKIPFLKLHGSLNWFYCPKCDELDITIGRKGANELAGDHDKFICVNRFCTSNYQPLIVTPTMLKLYDNSFLQQLWVEAERTLSKSDEIIFIGYSLDPADHHIRSLLTKALINNSNNPRIVAIDKKPDKNDQADIQRINEVHQRYTTLFGKDRVDFRPIGLSNFLKSWDPILNIQ